MGASEPTTVPTSAELLAHADFLRALARGILRDDHAADDVVQDTFVAALEKPHRASWPLRGWLAGVARNLARMRVRSEVRRAARERAATAGGAVASAEDVAQRLEAQRRLVTEVVRLEEPFRTTIVLHFFDALSPAEIARRQAVPTKTVHSRLARGLARLRERLLSEAPEGSRKALVLIAGGAVMATSKTAVAAVAAVAALLLLAGGGFLVMTSGGGQSASTPPVAETQTAAGHDSAASQPRTGRVRADDRETVAEMDRLRAENEALRARVKELETPPPELPSGPDVVADARVTDDVGGSTGLLRLVVLDRRGKPQPERRAEVFPAWKKKEVLQLTTGPDGAVEARDLEPGRYQVQLMFPQGSWQRGLAIEAGRRTVVRFWVWGAEASAVEGRITRYGGDPARGLQVQLSHGTEGAHGHFVTTCDEQGTYAFEDVPPGQCTINVSTAAQSPFQRTIELPPGGKARLDLVVEVPVLRGTVTDQATGLAIQGVRTILSKPNTGTQWSTSTDAEGRFEFLDVPGDTYWVGLFRDGYGGGWRKDVQLTDGQQRQLDLALRPAALLRLHIVDPEGVRYYGRIFVGLRAPEDDKSWQRDMPTLDTDEQGYANCRQVVPGDYELLVNVYDANSRPTFGAKLNVRIAPGENQVEVKLEKK